MKRSAPIIRLVTTLALLMGGASLWANPTDPFPSVNFREYYGNMTMAVKVMRGSDVLQDVVVAVYSGSEIRGKGFPNDPSNLGVSYITVYGNNTGEKLLFKVYVESDNDTYDVDDDQEFIFNGSLGSPLSPYMVFLADAQHPITLTESEGITESLASSISGKESRFIRSFTAGKASTICLPFPMTSIEGGKVYEFRDVSYDANDGWVATMIDASPDAGNLLSSTEAGKPYLFMPAADGEVTFSGTASVGLSATAGTFTNGDWTFHGTYTRLAYKADGSMDLSGTVFGFASVPANVGGHDIKAGEFVKAADGAGVPPFRAYLTYSGSNAALQAPARGDAEYAADVPDHIAVRLLGKDGSLTAVGSMMMTTGEFVIDTWYNLSGCPVEGIPSVPGLYINNGRKILIK